MKKSIVLSLPIALRLKFRVKGLSYFLRSQGVNCNINLHYRKSTVAHRWSTAHSIAVGNTAMRSLRELKDGCALDGNRWFSDEWGVGVPDDAKASDCEAVLGNARALGANDLAYAEEGYEAGDPRRFPNVPDIPVSNHVCGRAIDLNVDWGRLGGPWSKGANELVRQFGLKRPYADEAWHVELDDEKKPGFGVFHLIRWVTKS